MGDGGDGAEVVDEKLWGDDDDEAGKDGPDGAAQKEKYEKGAAVHAEQQDELEFRGAEEDAGGEGEKPQPEAGDQAEQPKESNKPEQGAAEAEERGDQGPINEQAEDDVEEATGIAPQGRPQSDGEDGEDGDDAGADADGEGGEDQDPALPEQMGMEDGMEEVSDHEGEGGMSGDDAGDDGEEGPQPPGALGDQMDVDGEEQGDEVECEEPERAALPEEGAGAKEAEEGEAEAEQAQAGPTGTRGGTGAEQEEPEEGQPPAAAPAAPAGHGRSAARAAASAAAPAAAGDDDMDIGEADDSAEAPGDAPEAAAGAGAGGSGGGAGVGGRDGAIAPSEGGQPAGQAQPSARTPSEPNPYRSLGDALQRWRERLSVRAPTPCFARLLSALLCSGALLGTNFPVDVTQSYYQTL